jgi:beta-lactamase regulating signal transducer with metallopeptidase domain
MNPLLYYLIQVVVASGILYLYYHLALRNKRFHQYNRFYLLGAVVISILVPFLNIPVYFTPQETQSSIIFETLTVISSPVIEQVPIAHPIVVESSGPVSVFNPYDLLYYAYILIAILAWARIMYSLFRISWMKRNNTVEKIDTIFFVNTNEPGTPFSFFRWMFWNRNIELQSEKGEQIFRHELYHIQQKHSIDLLFMEMLTMIFWINPFFHIMKKELRAIHEFLADQFAVTKSNKWNYAELLLMQALKTNHSLVNPFFHNQIKRRIAMITNSEKTSHRYLRKLLVLPIAVLIVTVFAFKYQEATIEDNLSSDNITTEGLSLVNTQQDRVVHGRLMQDTPKVIYERVEIEASFPGGESAWKAFLENNLDENVAVKNKAKPGTYTVFIQFIVDKEGNTSGFKALTAHGYGMEEEALRVLRKVTKWHPALMNGKPVNAYRRQAVTFRILSEKEDKAIQKQVSEAFAGVVPIQASISNPTKTSKLLGEVYMIAFYDTDLFPTQEKQQMPNPLEAGSNDWKYSIQRGLDANMPVFDGHKSGTFKLMVNFAADANGNVTDVMVQNYPGSKMADHCLEFFRKIPKIIVPADMAKGVTTTYIQPVTFTVTPGISLADLKKSTPHQLLEINKDAEIKSFTFTIDFPDGTISQAVNNGNKFNEKILKLIREAAPERMITIDNITVFLGGNEKKMPSKLYYINKD